VRRLPRDTRITPDNPASRSIARTLLLVLCAAFGTVGCSEPPQKEIDQAQAAVDAARSVRADQYATEEYTAAAAALQKAHDAVDQRDYRQALSYAIDARQRASDARRQAEGGRTRARRASEALVTDCSARISQLDTDIKVAADQRIRARDLRPAQTTLGDAANALQEARSSIDAGNYQEVVARLTKVRRNLDAALASVDALRQHPPRKRR
jgi:predicted S18 family serine protease